MEETKKIENAELPLPMFKKHDLVLVLEHDGDKGMHVHKYGVIKSMYYDYEYNEVHYTLFEDGTSWTSNQLKLVEENPEISRLVERWREAEFNYEIDEGGLAAKRDREKVLSMREINRLLNKEQHEF